MRSTARQAGAALQAGGKDFGQQLDAGRGGDARGRQQRRLAQRASAEQQRIPAARLQHARDRRDGVVRVARRRRIVGGAAGTPPSPQDTSAGRISVATWPGGPVRRGDGLDGVAAQVRPCSARCAPSGDTLRATVSMSDCSWASYLTW